MNDFTACLVTPKQDGEEAGEDANADDEESATVAEKDKSLTPPPPPPAPPAPDTQLLLEWVYGYSAALSRASVRYTASGAVSGDGVGVVYPAGKVAVVLAQPLDEEGAEIEGKHMLHGSTGQGRDAQHVSIVKWQKCLFLVLRECTSWLKRCTW